MQGERLSHANGASQLLGRRGFGEVRGRRPLGQNVSSFHITRRLFSYSYWKGRDNHLLNHVLLNGRLPLNQGRAHPVRAKSRQIPSRRIPRAPEPSHGPPTWTLSCVLHLSSPVISPSPKPGTLPCPDRTDQPGCPWLGRRQCRPFMSVSRRPHAEELSP